MHWRAVCRDLDGVSKLRLSDFISDDRLHIYFSQHKYFLLTEYDLTDSSREHPSLDVLMKTQRMLMRSDETPEHKKQRIFGLITLAYRARNINLIKACTHVVLSSELSTEDKLTLINPAGASLFDLSVLTRVFSGSCDLAEIFRYILESDLTGIEKVGEGCYGINAE